MIPIQFRLNLNVVFFQQCLEGTIEVMKKSISIFLSILLIVALVTGCFGPDSNAKLRSWMAQDGRVKILCTTQMVADIVQEVGGDLVDCYTLIRGESDPHSYQLVKGDDEKLARADIIFYNGLGLEHGPSLAQYLKGNNKAHALGDWLKEQNPSKIIFVEEVTDPHIWMDVGLWSETLDYVAEILGKSLPHRKERFIGQKDVVQSRLKSLQAEIIARMTAIPVDKRYLVTTHDAFNYYVRAYFATNDERNSGQWRARCMAPEGLAPDSQISTADLQKLIEHIMAHDIRVVFAESNVSRDSLKKLIDSLKQKNYVLKIAPLPLYADAMGPEGSSAGTYSGMMRYDSQVIGDELIWNPLADISSIATPGEMPASYPIEQNNSIQ